MFSLILNPVTLKSIYIHFFILTVPNSNFIFICKNIHYYIYLIGKEKGNKTPSLICGFAIAPIYSETQSSPQKWSQMWMLRWAWFYVWKCVISLGGPIPNHDDGLVWVWFLGQPSSILYFIYKPGTLVSLKLLLNYL